MLIENNFDITQTVNNDGTISFRQINEQFNSISTNDNRIIKNDDQTYFILKLNVNFAGSLDKAPQPTFLLNGSAIPYEVVTNISRIDPQQGTVQIISPPEGIYEAYVSSIFMSLQDEGKQLSCTVYADQSVLESWMINETAIKLNQLEPETINGKLSTITKNSDNTYNGNFKNINQSLQDLDTRVNFNKTEFENIFTKNEDDSYTQNIKTIFVDNINSQNVTIQDLTVNGTITGVVSDNFMKKYIKIYSTPRVIASGTIANLIEDLTESNLSNIYGNRASELIIFNNAIKTPSIEYCDYNISLRLTGTFSGASSTGRIIKASIRRLDGTVVVSNDILKVNEDTITLRGVEFPTFSQGINDPFITQGFRVVLDNTVANSVSFSLQSYELLIKGIV